MILFTYLLSFQSITLSLCVAQEDSAGTYKLKCSGGGYTCSWDESTPGKDEAIVHSSRMTESINLMAQDSLLGKQSKKVCLKKLLSVLLN